MTTAAQANSSSSKKVAGPVKASSNIQLMRDITQSLLNQYFPELKAAPNILYITMATWGMESSFRLIHELGNSIHLRSRNSPATSFLGPDYYYTPTIQNLLLRNPPDPELVKNIDQGLYPHGVSAVIGAYHVQGTKAFNYMMKPNMAIVSSLGLAVQPGQPITDIFPDSELGLTRSIGAGLVVYDNKYKIFRKRFSPSEAISKAVVAYVGEEGAMDVNKYRPEDRLASVSGRRTDSSTQSILAKLAEIGLYPDQPLQVAQQSDTISTSGQSYVSGKGDSPNTSSRSASTSSSPAREPGCTT